MNSYGQLVAPDVTITAEKSSTINKASITAIIDSLRKINDSVKKKNRDESGADNVIGFKKKNGIEKKVYLLVSEKSSEGYSNNKKWQGEVLLFRQDENGCIELNNKKYNVYLMSEEKYEELKKYQKKIGKEKMSAGRDKGLFWENGIFKSADKFESYIKGEEKDD